MPWRPHGGVVVLVVSLGAHAQVSKDPAAKGVHTTTITLHRPPTFVNQLGPLELFKSTKADVLEALGEKQEVRFKQGGCCGDSICYLDGDGALYADFQFGPSTGFQQLSGYRLSRARGQLARKGECRQSTRLRQVADGGAVRLGDPALKLTEALGLTNRVGDGRYKFLYEKEVPFTEADAAAYRREGKKPPDEKSWTLFYRVDVTVSGGLVEELAALRTETF